MDTDQLLQQVMDDFVNRQASFTPLDITKAACQVQFVRHSTSRQFVHNYMNSLPQGMYAVTNIPVTLEDGSTARANLYHPVGVDPDSYQARSQSLKDCAAPAPASNIASDPLAALSSQNPVAAVAPSPAPVTSPYVPQAPADPSKQADNFLDSVLQNIQNARSRFFKP